MESLIPWRIKILLRNKGTGVRCMIMKKYQLIRTNHIQDIKEKYFQIQCKTYICL